MWSGRIFYFIKFWGEQSEIILTAQILNPPPHVGSLLPTTYWPLWHCLALNTDRGLWSERHNETQNPLKKWGVSFNKFTYPFLFFRKLIPSTINHCHTAHSSLSSYFRLFPIIYLFENLYLWFPIASLWVLSRGRSLRLTLSLPWALFKMRTLPSA